MQMYMHARGASIVQSRALGCAGSVPCVPRACGALLSCSVVQKEVTLSCSVSPFFVVADPVHAGGQSTRNKKEVRPELPRTENNDCVVAKQHTHVYTA